MDDHGKATGDVGSVVVRPPRNASKSIFWWLVAILTAILLFVLLESKKRNFVDVPLSEFDLQLQNKNVALIAIDENVLRGKFFKPVPVGQMQVLEYRVELPPNTAQSWVFMQWLLQKGGGSAEIRVENNQNLLMNLLLPLVPWVFVFVFVWFFVFRKLRAEGQPKQPLRVIIVNPENK